MKKYLTAAAAVLILSFASVLSAGEDIMDHKACKYCNMDRQAFAHSRMLINYTDGTSVGTCSLHCTTRELTANLSKVPCRITVGDYNTKKLINVAEAHWVIGGDRPGVMTERGKWAFEKKAEADDFINKHGGKAATFNEALRAAYDDLYADVKATLDRVKERRSHGWDMCEQSGH
jgi:copper chaperone NosL